MKSLKDRWKTPEGAQLRQQVISALKENKGLDNVEGLQKYNHKYDLRGITFPHLVGETTKTGKISLTQVERTQFYNTELVNADLSYCDLALTDFIDSNIENVHAIRGKFTSARLLGTDMSNCIFDECNLEQVMMGMYRRQTNHICIFKNNYFIKSNFKNANFSVAEYRKVVFDNCKLKEIDFDGTMFYDCVFKGELDSVQFYGYRRYSGSPRIEAIEPKLESYFNPMQNIDFTEARLLGVGFRQQCDVSTCKFPVNENYVYFPNDQHKLKIVKEKINILLIDKSKEWALKGIQGMQNWFEREKTQLYIIDRYIEEKYFGIEFTDKYFSILREVIALPDEPEQDEKPKGVWGKVQNFLKGKEN